MDSLEWLCNFNVQICQEWPIFSLFTPDFWRMHIWIKLKQFFIFSPSKVGPWPPSDPSLIQLSSIVYSGEKIINFLLVTKIMMIIKFNHYA